MAQNDNNADRPLIITTSGVFSEMQAALNAIWKAKPKSGTVSRLDCARAVSLGLVGALGFLLMISLVVSTALNALANYLDPFCRWHTCF
jgi:membrane protein